MRHDTDFYYMWIEFVSAVFPVGTLKCIIVWYGMVWYVMVWYVMVLYGNSFIQCLSHTVMPAMWLAAPQPSESL